MSPRKRTKPVATPPRTLRRQPPRCNDLDGKRWLQNSISVWSDLRKTAEEQRLKHPAQFPVALVERLIESFLPATGDHVVLDPFCGSGSTLVAAQRRGKRSVGIELSAEYVTLAQSRLTADAPEVVIHNASAETLSQHLSVETIDLCVTSPPYWNILGQKRTADYKTVRHYGNHVGDLGTVTDYEGYLDALTEVFRQVFAVLKPGAHGCINVMDLRKKDRFYPLHSDLARRLETTGYRLDDIIIWNRQAEYNSLRPLGYPAVFRINKVHEYILLMQKPGRLRPPSAGTR